MTINHSPRRVSSCRAPNDASAYQYLAGDSNRTRRVIPWVGRILDGWWRISVRDSTGGKSGLLLYLSEIGLDYLPKFWILNLQ
jgi:hypothetical protein